MQEEAGSAKKTHAETTQVMGHTPGTAVDCSSVHAVAQKDGVPCVSKVVLTGASLPTPSSTGRMAWLCFTTGTQILNPTLL